MSVCLSVPLSVTMTHIQCAVFCAVNIMSCCLIVKLTVTYNAAIVFYLSIYITFFLILFTTSSRKRRHEFLEVAVSASLFQSIYLLCFNCILLHLVVAFDDSELQ